MLRSQRFVFLSSVAAVLLVGLTAWQIHNKLKSDALLEIGQSLETVRDTTHQAVKSWQKELKASAQVWANTLDLRQAAAELLDAPRSADALIGAPTQARLRTWFRPVQSGTGYLGYFIVGPDNVNLASSRDQNIGQKTLLLEQTGFLQRIWSGESAVSLPEKSDVPLPDKDGILRDGIPTMFAGAPIIDDTGGVMAVFLFRIDPAETFTAILQQGRIGATGETYAFDGKGRLISNSRFDDHLREIGLLAPNMHGIFNIEIRDPGANLSQVKKSVTPRQLQPLTRMAASAITGEADIDLQGYRDYRGVSVIGAWLWDPELDFGITTELDESEAYQSLRSTQNFIALFTAFSMLLLLALTVILIINRERRQAEQALRRAHDELEIRVQQRTAELATVNKKILGEVEERKRTEKELQRLSTAVQQSPASIVITDTAGTIEYVNPKFSEVTGYSYEEAIGQNPRILKSGEQTLEFYQDLWAKVASGKEWRGVFHNKKKNGELFWENASISPIVDQKGEISSFVAVKEDITERMRAEENERQHLLELAHISRLSTMGEMAAQIAHELNQPLTAIASTSDALSRLIESNSLSTSDMHDALGAISNQAHRGGEIIRHLRSFVRKEAIQKIRFDVNKVIQDVLQLINVELRRHTVRVVQDMADLLLEANGDQILIEQVILNLVRNAIDAMANERCSERKLLIKTQILNKDEIKVTITDTGPGLTPEALTKIFEPFYTTKESGMGMGLSISRSIIESHGGKLWATSKPEQGTTFCFTLPIAYSEEY